MPSGLTGLCFCFGASGNAVTVSSFVGGGGGGGGGECYDLPRSVVSPVDAAFIW